MRLNNHRKLTVGKGLIATLLFTWLSIYCQHCLAFPQQEQFQQNNTEISHAHCVAQTKQQVQADTDLSCIGDCSSPPAIQDSNKLQKNGLENFTQYISVASNDFTYRQTTTEMPFQEFPPDQSLFLPLERYTVQLK